MARLSHYTKYPFEGHSRYIITPHNSGHGFVAVRHTAFVAPWVDPDVHTHETSEEYYFLLQGELRFWLAGTSLTLRANEVLMVRPHIPHAIVSGEGPIEHFGIRAPAPEDRHTVGAIPWQLPPVTEEDTRELRRDWGYRIPLGDARNRNCWLVGVGSARFTSDHLILAYLDFSTAEAANAGIGTRHRLHLHKQSWEYYAVLQGTKTLWIAGETVTITAGEMLEVPPQVKHTLHSRQAPYLGFTFRVPVADDKEEC